VTGILGRGDNPPSTKPFPALVSGWHLLPEAEGLWKNIASPSPTRTKKKTKKRPAFSHFAINSTKLLQIKNKNASLKSEIQLQNLGKKNHLENLQNSGWNSNLIRKDTTFFTYSVCFCQAKVSFHPWAPWLIQSPISWTWRISVCFFVGFYGTKMDSITRWRVIISGICWTL